MIFLWAMLHGFIGWISEASWLIRGISAQRLVL
jgi:hypothetical protein